MRCKALLRRGPVNRSNTLTVADLELDRLTQQIRRAGKRIELTAKEYSLAEYLMKNVDLVLSRNMTIEHVWDQSLDGVTDIVDIFVRHLFERIFRSDEARSRQSGGTGLGLSIVHAICKEHGGYVTIDSAEGLVTTVCVGHPLSARS